MGPKAKILALGSGELAGVTYFGQPDYPLVWPSVWAFSGWCSGGWEEQWSKGWGTIFMALCAWSIFATVRQQINRKDMGIIGAAMFLSVPMVPMLASWAYAEAPLWLMMTCSYGRLLRWQTSGKPVDLVVGGVLACVAAHTKNEGLLFLILGFLWIAGMCWRYRRRVTGLVLYLLPVAVLYLPWFVWIKCGLSLPTDSISGLRADWTHIAATFHRMPNTIQQIGAMWIDLRLWNIVLIPLLVLAIYLFVAGSFRTCGSMLMPFAVLVSSFVIVSSHRIDPGWQVGMAWNRVTALALPMLLIAVLCAKSRKT